MRPVSSVSREGGKRSLIVKGTMWINNPDFKGRTHDMSNCHYNCDCIMLSESRCALIKTRSSIERITVSKN
jgi:hypothetical protein